MCAACHSLWDATALNHISGSNDEPGTVTAMIQFEGCTTFGLSSTPGDIPCQGPWPAPLDSCQLLRRPTSTPKASFILTAPTSEKQLGCEGRAQVRVTFSPKWKAHTEHQGPCDFPGLLWCDEDLELKLTLEAFLLERREMTVGPCWGEWSLYPCTARGNGHQGPPPALLMREASNRCPARR